MTEIERSLAALISPAVNYGKILVYSLESLPIIATRRLLGLRPGGKQGPPKEHRRELHREIVKMVNEERDLIESGLLSPRLLVPGGAREHARRYFDVLMDSLEVASRIRTRQTKTFSDSSKEYLKSVPDYYARNFHFQTDGYLSPKSAELYDHQTEILFMGTLGLMRRLLMADLLRLVHAHPVPPEVLELGSGAGETSEILLRSAPVGTLTCVDLSEPYLNHARKRLQDFPQTQFTRGDGAEVNLGKKFDFVFSAFCLHEMPEDIRRKFIANAMNHLRPGGHLLLIDSIQMDDRPEFNWALEQFPKDFHEPFYKNYIQTPLTDLIPENTEVLRERTRFLSKSLLLRRS